MDGNYTVNASRDGYGIEFLHDVEVSGAGRALDIRMRKAATLHLVVREASGRPFTGKLVLSFRPKVEGEGTRVGTGVTTDAEGQATYRQVLPGEYSIRLGTYDRKLSAAADATIGPGETTLELTLR